MYKVWYSYPDDPKDGLRDIVADQDAVRMAQSKRFAVVQLEPTILQTPTAYCCPDCGELEPAGSIYDHVRHRLLCIIGKNDDSTLQLILQSCEDVVDIAELCNMPTEAFRERVQSVVEREVRRQTRTDRADVEAPRSVQNTAVVQPIPSNVNSSQGQDVPAASAEGNTVRLFPVAEQAEQEEIPPLRLPKPIDAESQLDKAIARFIQDRYSTNARNTTIRLYRTILRVFSQYLHGIRVSNTKDITPDHIKGFLADQRDKGRADATIKGYRGILLPFLEMMSDEGDCMKVDWRKAIRTVRVDKKEPRYLTQDEIGKLIDVVDTKMYHPTPWLKARNLALLSVMVDTGLRAGELLRLKRKDIDLTACSVFVSSKAKSRRERTPPFSEVTANRLRDYLLAVGHEKFNSDTALWLTHKKNPLNYRYLHELISQIAEAADMEGVTLHTFRHSCASLLANSGMPITQVQRILGHCKLDITERYVHTDVDQIRASYDKVAPMAAITAAGVIPRLATTEGYAHITENDVKAKFADVSPVDRL